MALATTTTSASPFAKLVEIGDTVIGALASDPGKSKRQQIGFTSRKPEFKDDGKPRMEEILHLVAMPGTTGKTGTAETGYQQIQPGDHVRYAISGFKWKQVIDARKALPAYGPVKAGQPGSGDVYTIRLIGWSVATDNPQAAIQAGFNVVDGRIIMRTNEEREQYVLAKMRQGGGNVTTGSDIEITCRRPNQTETSWEAQADALYLTKPWVGDANQAEPYDDEPGPFTPVEQSF